MLPVSKAKVNSLLRPIDMEKIYFIVGNDGKFLMWSSSNRIGESFRELWSKRRDKIEVLTPEVLSDRYRYKRNILARRCIFRQS